MAKDGPLKITFLNPVCSAEDNELFADVIKKYKNPRTEVQVVSLKGHGETLDHLEYQSYEAFISRNIVRAARQLAIEGEEAMAIGCFYDTALVAAREVSMNMPVAAPCQASIEIATTFANSFGIIIGRRKWVHRMQETVRSYGYHERLTGFYPVSFAANQFQADPVETNKRLLEAGRIAVEVDGAEALVLGCTTQVGFHDELQRELDVPIVDPVIAVIKRAEFNAELARRSGLKPSRKWSCEPPPESELERFGIFQEDSVIDNRIIVPATS